MYVAPMVNFAGYLGRQQHIVLDEDSEMLWIGRSQEALDAIPIQRMPEPRNTRRSILLARHRKYATHQGELIHVSSPNDGERYFWQGEGRTLVQQVGVCRPQDFTFKRSEEDQLTVTPRQRKLYCVGRTRTRITAVAITDDNDPESAEVFTGRRLGDLERKMVFHKEAIGDRLEIRYRESVLKCDRHGMLLGSEPLRMLDSGSFRLKINNRKGTARLIRLPRS